METYDYKKKPVKKKIEERDKKVYSDVIKKEGHPSYRRLTKSELKRQKKAAAKEKVLKKQKDKEATEQLVNDLFFFLKLLPFVFMFFIFTSTSFGDGIIAGFEMFLGDVLPGGFSGTLESRIMVFIMLAVFVFMQSSRRHRLRF